MSSRCPKLRIPDEVGSLIRSLHPDLKRKIKAGVQRILDNAESGKMLKDDLSGLRSFRVGKFRIIYRNSKAMIEIIALGPRKTIYEETLRLVRTRRGHHED